MSNIHRGAKTRLILDFLTDLIEVLFSIHQGDPIAMSMYAMGILPLLLLNLGYDAKRIAFADDFTGIGKINKLKIWWDSINEHGPFVGYYPEPSKSWLIVKENHLGL